MAKHNSEKRKKSSFYEEKSLVGLTPGLVSNIGQKCCSNKLFVYLRERGRTKEDDFRSAGN